MTLQTIIDMIKTDGGSYIVIFIIMSSLIEISPIKINPISAICKWISSKFNADIVSKIDKIEKKLDDHIVESNAQNTRMVREEILSFGNSIISNKQHTKEEYDFIITECDKYEKYCNDNNIPNGVAKATIAEIRRRYALCLKNNSFLQ